MPRKVLSKLSFISTYSTADQDKQPPLHIVTSAKSPSTPHPSSCTPLREAFALSLFPSNCLRVLLLFIFFFVFSNPTTFSLVLLDEDLMMMMITKMRWMFGVENADDEDDDDEVDEDDDDADVAAADGDEDGTDVWR